MLDPITFLARLQGCDAEHRASNSDTHLTHGCIQLFRHFSRVRKGCAGSGEFGTGLFAWLCEGAQRTLAETAR